MNLFIVKGVWTGSKEPEVKTIKLQAKGSYDWDTAEYLVYDSSWSYKETAPVFNSDGTWTFLVPETNIPPVDTGRKVGNASVVSYAEAVNKPNMKAVVTYLDESGASKEASATLLMNPEEFGTISFGPGHSSATNPVFVNTGDAQFDIVYTIDPTKIRAGARLAIYVDWSDYDTLSNQSTKRGLIKKVLELDQYVGRNDFLALTETLSVPQGSTRAKFFVLPYNVNELPVVDYLVPTTDSEVTVKGAGWHHVEQKYIRWISEEDYNALWEAAKAKSNPVDSTRIGLIHYQPDMFGGLVNSTDVNFVSGSAGTADERSSWDGEVFKKIFSGPSCCVAQRADGSTFGIGNTSSAPLSYLKANPLPNTVTKVAIGTMHIAGLTSDGKVIHIGYDGANWYTAANSWTGIVDIAAGDIWTAGLKADGSIVVVKSGTNAYVDTSAFAGKILKKIYSMGTDRIIAIDDTGKILISGTDSGATGFRTAISTWPGDMTHVTASNYKIYAFCKDYTKRQLWSTDPDEHDKLSSWHHLVAGVGTLTGFIGIRCDGQILATEWKNLQIRKKSGYPSTWIATPN